MNKAIIFFKNIFCIKGSWNWAIKQMLNDKIVKPKNISGEVKYRFSADKQHRLEWNFQKIPDKWESAYFFYSNIYKEWELLNE